MATFAANKLDYIVNPVLLELGHTRLSSLDPASSNKVESLCALTVNSLIDAVLKMEPWVSVSKRDSSLAANPGTSDEFTYLYDLPSDFVRMIGEPIYFGSPKHYAQYPRVDWRVVGSVLECASVGPDILYVYKPVESDKTGAGTDSTDYYSSIMGSEVHEAIMGMCRWKWAYSITGDAKMRQYLATEFIQLTMRNARAANLVLIKRMAANNQDALRFVKLLGV